ncbi:MAG: HEAT repeat domain-containing protein [bacterium]
MIARTQERKNARTIMIFLLLVSFCFADETVRPVAEKGGAVNVTVDPRLFGSALENFLNANYEEAYKDADKLYILNPNEARVKDLYSKILVKMALSLEENKKYEGALDYITRSEKIQSSSETKEIKDRILKKIPRKKVSDKKASAGKEKPVRKPPPVKTVEQSKKIQEITKSEPAKMEYPTSVFILSFLNLLGLVFLAYFVAVAFSKKKETKLIEEERRISQIVQSLGSKGEYQALVQNQQEIMNTLARLPEETSMMKLQNAEIIRLVERLTRGGASSNIELPEESGRAGITGVDDTPRIRADTVELIADMFKDSPVMEDLLEPYLHDRNNRVLANACRALFPYNRRRTLNILRDMASTDDVWMRLSAAWTCGELGVSECVKILTPLLSDTSSHVRVRALTSFENLKKKAVEIPLEVEEKIRELKEKEAGINT